MPVCIDKIIAIDVVVNEEKITEKVVVDGVETEVERVIKEDSIQVFVKKPSTVSLTKKVVYFYRMFGEEKDENGKPKKRTPEELKQYTDNELEYIAELQAFGLSAIVGFKAGDVLIGNDDMPLIGDYTEKDGKFVSVANPTPNWRDRVRELLPEVTTAVGKYLVTDSTAKVKRKN
jgi:hypothetical protein